MKYFDENATKVIFTLTTFNHFRVNEKDTSKNLLNPQPGTEDLITNSHISLSEYDSTQSSTINTSNISPSKTTLYQEYQIKLTGDDTSESMNKISSILESYRPQTRKLTNGTKYQQIPISSTPVKTLRQSKKQVESSSIIEFKAKIILQAPETNFVNYNDYKVIIAKFEVKLYSIEDFLPK